MLFWEPLLWYQIDPLFYTLSVDYVKLFHLLLVGLLLVFIGFFGICFYYERLSVIHFLLLLEVILLGLNLITIVVAQYYSNPIGFLLIFFFLTLAAAESAIGLTLLILFYRVREETLLQNLNRLFG
jgi:NADH-quinone oxidoreductase subunit K